MATKAAQKRLSKEYVTMQREPPPFVWAAPDEKNILTWNYLIRGPPESPYAGGEFHGVLLFPAEYPFKPPGIKMYTPSGRFQPDKKICFSMSDFHPGTWNPAWSVATILTGLLSFMLSDEVTTGSLTTSDVHKRAFALRSHEWNLSQPRFKEAFPEFCTPVARDPPNMGEKERGKSDSSQPQSPQSSSHPNGATGVKQVLALNPASAQAKQQQQQLSSAKTVPGAAAPVPSTVANNAVGRQDDPRGATAGWVGTWGRLLRDKWPLGLLLALAVMVSRWTSNP